MMKPPPKLNKLPRFAENVKFMQHVARHGHVPMWVHPKLAHQLLMQHGETGHVIPHPNINLGDLTQ
jgi:hypothetical protein